MSASTDVDVDATTRRHPAAPPLAELFAGPMWRHDFWGQDLASGGSHKSWRPLTVLSFRLNAAAAGLEPTPPEWVDPDGGDPVETDRGAASPGRGRDDVSGGDGTADGSDSRPRPFGFHAVNVVLHAAATALVHLVSLRVAMMGRPSGEREAANSARRQAGLAAALFAVHPVHTEAVAGLVGRAELLCGIFFLAGVLAYASAADARSTWASFVWAGAAAAAMLAATLCKESGITAAGVYAAYELVVVAGIGGLRVDGVGVGRESGASGKKMSDGKNDDDARGDREERPGRCSSGTTTSGVYAAARRLLPSAVACAGYWLARRRLTGADTLVRIYRKVENPIAFSSNPLERLLSLLHLHALYARLAFWPARLSCDWSFSCVPMVSSLWDPRNAGWMALYAAGAAVAAAAAPLTPSGVNGADGEGRLIRARVRAFVVALAAAPFVPASNVFFYVGTFIGERLLYLPSVGACMLVAEGLETVFSGGHPPNRGGASNPGTPETEEGPRGRRRTHGLLRKAAAGFVAAALVSVGAVRTVRRNEAWRDDAALFAAAEETCPDSAKVQLNLGILARRRREFSLAADRFRRARAIEPGFCEPTYWLAVTAVNQGRTVEGLDGLVESLACVWTRSDALAAIRDVYQSLFDEDDARVREANAGRAGAGGGDRIEGNPALRESYARALLATGEEEYEAAACDYLTEAAMIYTRAGDRDAAAAAAARCTESVEERRRGARTFGQSSSEREAREEDAGGASATEASESCAAAQARLSVALAGLRRLPPGGDGSYPGWHGEPPPPEGAAELGVLPLPPRVDADLTAYLARAECRSATGAHLRVVHAAQSADHNDPRLHEAWAGLLTTQGRRREAARHLAVAAAVVANLAEAMPPLRLAYGLAPHPGHGDASRAAELYGMAEDALDAAEEAGEALLPPLDAAAEAAAAAAAERCSVWEGRGVALIRLARDSPDATDRAEATRAARRVLRRLADAGEATCGSAAVAARKWA